MAFCAKCGKELPAGATFCPSCGAPVQPGATPAPSAAVSGFDTLTKDQKAQEYWVQRLIAFVIDAVIVFAVLGLITLAIYLPIMFSGVFSPAGFLLGGVFTFFWGIIFVLYFTVLESTSGASIGKRIFSLKVVNKSGSSPNLGEAFIRNLSKLYWLLLILDVIVGLALSKGYQQKYSDQLMGTSVVHT